jgi:hypothetical protein
MLEIAKVLVYLGKRALTEQTWWQHKRFAKERAHGKRSRRQGGLQQREEG